MNSLASTLDFEIRASAHSGDDVDFSFLCDDVDGPYDSGFDNAQFKLVKRAWALLRLNTDLIRWAICVGLCGRPGNKIDNVVDCAMDKLSGDDPLHIWVNDSGGFHAHDGLERIYIPLPHNLDGTAGGTSQWPASYVLPWCQGGPDDKLCIEIALAQVLLHEMMHTCGVSYLDTWDAKDEDNCDESYLIGHSFLWAMLSRYPDALNAPCCSGWAQIDPTDPRLLRLEPVDELFMWDITNNSDPSNPGGTAGLTNLPCFPSQSVTGKELPGAPWAGVLFG